MAGRLTGRAGHRVKFAISVVRVFGTASYSKRRHIKKQKYIATDEEVYVGGGLSEVDG